MLSSQPTIHLRFLDGIRALAALYVVLFHLTSVLPHEALPPLILALLHPLWFGHLAVGVFIVLSGFVLMLPVVGSDGFQLRGGLQEYFRRRARRILIPYYAAFLLAIPPDMYRQHQHNESFPWTAFIAHLLVFHDLRSDWMGAFNSPLWSVAVEWHIYFIFALVLLPLLRRLGFIASALFALGLGIVPQFLLSPEHSFGWACPWYLALFSWGNIAAYLAFNRSDAIRDRTARVPWGICAFVLFVSLLVALQIHGTYSYIIDDLLTGLISCCFILYCVGVVRSTSTIASTIAAASGVDTGHSETSAIPAGKQLQYKVVDWLGCQQLVFLSTFSYSIYLTHFPTVSVLDTILKKYIHSELMLEVVQLIVCLPICLLVAYLFSLAFERPFTRTPRTGNRPQETRAASGAESKVAESHLLTAVNRVQQ